MSEMIHNFIFHLWEWTKDQTGCLKKMKKAELSFYIPLERVLLLN